MPIQHYIDTRPTNTHIIYRDPTTGLFYVRTDVIVGTGCLSYYSGSYPYYRMMLDVDTDYYFSGSSGQYAEILGIPLNTLYNGGFDLSLCSGLTGTDYRVSDTGYPPLYIKTFSSIQDIGGTPTYNIFISGGKHYASGRKLQDGTLVTINAVNSGTVAITGGIFAVRNYILDENDNILLSCAYSELQDTNCCNDFDSVVAGLPSPCSCNTRVFLGSYSNGSKASTYGWNSYDLTSGNSSVSFNRNDTAGTLGVSFTGIPTDTARWVYNTPQSLQFFNPYIGSSPSLMSGITANINASLNSNLYIRLGVSTSPTGSSLNYTQYSRSSDSPESITLSFPFESGLITNNNLYYIYVELTEDSSTKGESGTITITDIKMICPTG